MADSFSLEPATPDLLESYLYDAWDVLSRFSDAVATAGEGAPETQATLSLLSHRLRGTSAQYGFTQTAKLAELVETLLEHAPKLPPERRGDLQVFLEQVMACLGSSLERVAATGKEGGVGLEFAAIGGSRLLKALLKSSPEAFVRQGVPKAKVEVAVTRATGGDTTTTLRRFYQDHAEDWEFFAPEAAEHVEMMAQATDEAAARLANNEAADDQVGALFRATHTLKGAAYMVGLTVMGDLIHKLEDLMVQVRDGVRDFDAAALHLLETGHHTLSLMLETAPGKATPLETVLAEHRRDAALFFGLPEPEAAPATAQERAPEIEDAEAGVAPLRAELQQFYASQQDVWSYFEPEVYEHLATVQGFLTDAVADPDEDMLAELYRAVHTLKGAAYIVGLTVMGDLSARLEHLLTDVREQDLPFADVRDTLSQGAHLIDLMVQTAQGQDVALGAAYRDFGLKPQVDASAATAATAEAQPQVGVALKVTSQGSVRVRLDKLERLMTLAGDTVTLRSRLERQTAQLAQVSQLLRTSRARMLRTVTEFEANYLNPQLDAQKTDTQKADTQKADTQKADAAAKNAPDAKQGLRASLDELFDDLEFDTYNDLNILARSVAEMADDLGEVETQLGTLTRGYVEETDLLQKLSRELRGEVGRARLVPVGQLFGRLRRLLKNTGSRSYQLDLSGESVEIDTLVLEGLTDPLLHLVRNALVHGVEPSERRAALGKTLEGNVSLRAYPLGNNVYIEVEDDGAGIDLAAVKRKAVATGLKTQREVEALDDVEAAQLIFLPGLSTASAISTEAGRGVGMDAVLEGVTALKGEISIRTEPGVGTRFTLKLPLTLIVSEVLKVRAADQVVAFPANAVEVLRYLPAAAFERVGDKEFVTTNDERLPFYDLTGLLGLNSAGGAPVAERPVALLKAGGARVAVGVDELLELEEVVVRGVSDLLKGVAYLSGTSVSSAGDVVLLLDPDGLRSLAGDSVRNETVSRPVRAAQSAGRRVLLVDDSVSVRRVLGKMLSRADYSVTTAVDGQEAVELILQGQRFDAVLTDLEMPRLNGYELIEEVRRRPDLAELPIIVMTTRAGEKHRNLAFDLGATDYFSKPADETKLLSALATAVRRVNAKPSGVS